MKQMLSANDAYMKIKRNDTPQMQNGSPYASVLFQTTLS